jgi:ATP-binding cassette subfamily B protein
MRDIFAEPVRIDDDKNKRMFPPEWKTISIRDVSFAYGNHVVLDHVSFDIHRGERIGIVGLSGAGKSTLFKLLLKEYEDFTGDILFDDVSIRKIKKSAYFGHVAVVLQDTEVFNISLKDNITIASPGQGSKKMLEQALEVAHVKDFMKKLPDGVHTIIGEKGVKLSGGEKQRVGIARAIYKQPDVLFLDEATSHLDLESEEKIKDSLHQFFQEVTAVVIAHRLTTIQEMDRILLIENGKLLESGDFAALMKQRGRFFELWEKQRL